MLVPILNNAKKYSLLLATSLPKSIFFLFYLWLLIYCLCNHWFYLFCWSIINKYRSKQEQEILFLDAYSQLILSCHSFTHSFPPISSDLGGDWQGHRQWIASIFTYITWSWALKTNYSTNCFRQDYIYLYAVIYL